MTTPMGVSGVTGSFGAVFCCCCWPRPRRFSVKIKVPIQKSAFHYIFGSCVDYQKFVLYYVASAQIVSWQKSLAYESHKVILILFKFHELFSFSKCSLNFWCIFFLSCSLFLECSLISK